MLRLNTLFARPALALITASALAAFAAPAMAASAPTAVVRLDAADLSAGDAATSIHTRISAAARRVCTPQGPALRDHMNARDCYAKAVRSGEVQLVALREQAKGNQPVLAAATR